MDNGSYTNFVKDSAGYGLAQWTYWSRKQAMLDYAKAAGKSIGNLATQLGFLCKELTGYATVLNALKAATSVKEASDIVLTQYEKPADQSDTVKAKRAAYGQTYYDKYAQNEPSAAFEPYRVRVSIANLNIRKGPGTNYKTVGRYTGKGVFTIVEEASGTGATKWGLLKSYTKSRAGWISLDYATKI